jgi:hypothetical protein
MPKIPLLALGAALAVTVASPRNADACGQGSNYGGLYTALAVGAIVIGGTDVVLTIWDLHSLSGPGPSSPTYGVLETLLAVPQLALGIAGLRSNGSGFFTGYTIWMGALAAHGIWSIAAGATARDPAPPHLDPPTVRGADEPVVDPPGTPDVPQVQFRFGPTYVPLGPLARPGFGLSMRF